MNKKIAGEIAVGIIFFLAVVVGGIFWSQNKKDISEQNKNITIEGTIDSFLESPYQDKYYIFHIYNPNRYDVWFSDAEVIGVDNSAKNPQELKKGYLVKIFGKNIGCPPGGMGPDDTICISADKIIIKDAK